MWMKLYSKDCDLIDAAKTRTTLHHPQGDALLRCKTTPSQGSAQTYPGYVVEQKQQLEETEQIGRENLKQAQKF